MNITPSALEAQYVQASRAWPFIASVEVRYRLPPYLLFAVGSRETNLTNEVGDGGHGHGVWQLDDRSHTIPAGFDANITTQAYTAAQMLLAAYQRCGNWLGGCAAYNSGQCSDAATTGGDYGADVMARRSYLAATYGTSSKGDQMLAAIVDPTTHDYVLVDALGEVFAFSGATGEPGGYYPGGLNNRPIWQAGGGAANGPVVGAIGVPDAHTPTTGRWALILTTRDAQGTFHAYTFPSDGSLA